MDHPCIEAATRWWQWHPPIGSYIGFLAFLGVVVPLFRDLGKIGPREKAIWTLVIFALFGLELRTLYLDRDEHDAEQALIRCRELESFQHIADTLSGAIAQANAQYTSTINHVDGVLATTQEVGKLSQQTLENVTGGNSYAYVIPATVVPRVGFSHPVTVDTRFSAWVQNNGKHILSGVFVSVVKMKNASGISDGGLIGPIEVGVMSGNSRVMLPRFFMNPEGDGTDHYFITITAQNGNYDEDLYFRKSKDGTGWAYRLTVNKRTLAKNGYPIHALLKTVEWTEPQILPAHK